MKSLVEHHLLKIDVRDAIVAEKLNNPIVINELKRAG